MSSDRINVKYHHWFLSQTDNGKAFRWLKDNLGSAYNDAITNAVRFVYLPIALAEMGASLQEVETEVRKAREFLNEKMMAALGSCCKQEENNSVLSNGASPVPLTSVRSFGIVSVGKENSNTPNGAEISSTAAIAPDNDFLELDEDKFMEG
jgi:hypothetical protein